MKRKPNIVVIGGGTGTYTVLSGLKKYPVHLSAIVSMADDGGSTRVLREEFGVLPPGSVRPAMVALSSQEETLAKLFSFRFSRGNLAGHNFGNLFLVALTRQLGSFEKAIEKASQLLHLKGEVIPSTLQKVKLNAELENGRVIRGETNIDVPQHNGNLRIQKVWLEPRAKANPKALEAIRKADLIVIGPGDLFSSIAPNFLVKGISGAIRKSKAEKIYVCNIMTKFGETTGFSAEDFLGTVEKYVCKNMVDYILLNSTKPSKDRVKKYEKEKSEFVEGNSKEFSAYGRSPAGRQGRNLKIIRKDFLRKTGFIRHDPVKLSNTLISLLKNQK